MWIGEFSDAAGLNVATVRYYVRAGLLRPRQGQVGGTRPYMEFSEKDLQTLRAIRAGQAMGMSLKEIKLLSASVRAGGRERMLLAMTAQRDRLEGRARQLSAMLEFVDAKIRWLRDGARGSPPVHSTLIVSETVTFSSGPAA